METKKKLVNKRLVSFLMDSNKFDLISISKDKVICTVNKKFKPADVWAFIAETGQTKPAFSSDNGVNYIIFDRR